MQPVLVLLLLLIVRRHHRQDLFDQPLARLLLQARLQLSLQLLFLHDTERALGLLSLLQLLLLLLQLLLQLLLGVVEGDALLLRVPEVAQVPHEGSTTTGSEVWFAG